MAKQTIDELAVIITANNQTNRGLDAAKKDFAKFAREVAGIAPPPPIVTQVGAKEAAELRRRAREAAKQVEDAKKQAAEVSAARRHSAGSVLGFMSKVAATGGTLLAAEAGLSGLAGAFQEVKESVRMAADLEQTKLGFEVMIGDARRATELVADVRRFAATTPFNTRELTDATRQLIAYGRSADVAVDDLKMLGDVSAAFGNRLPIGDLAYLYGTLYAQQRAYTKDLYQFSNRGIPILRELGKVTGKSGAELQQMVEDGRIGFEDIRKAFVGMTSEGGAFFGMTQRQGQTVAGVIEQMSDAFEMLKIEFGQVLIDELGIKKGAEELRAFAERLRENAGVIRPAVKFVGDLAKAGAQVSYEFGRAAVSVAAINLDALDRTFPGLRKAAENFHQMVKDAQEFKIDEEKLIDFGADLAGVLIAPLGGVAEFALDAFETAKTKYIQPLEKLIESINGMLGSLPRIPAPELPTRGELPAWFGLMTGGVWRDGDRAWSSARQRPDVPPAPPAPPPPVPVGRRDGDPIDVALFGNAHPGQSPARLLVEWQALKRAREDARGAMLEMEAALAAGRASREQFDNARRHLHRIDDLTGGFLGGFERPADAPRQLDRGDVPPVRGAGLIGPLAPPGQLAPPPPAAELTFAQRAVKAVGELRAQLLADSRKRRFDQDLAEFKKGVFSFGAPWHELAVRGSGIFPAPPVNKAANERAARAGAMGPIAVELPQISPDIDAMRLDIRRRYNPMIELDPIRKQLDEIKSRGLLGPNTDALVDRFWRDKVGEVAGRFGIDPHGRYQLPEATTVGTAEDARIITAWQTQGQNQVNVESLLQQLIRVAEAQVKAIDRIPRGVGQEMPRMPAPARLPGD